MSSKQVRNNGYYEERLKKEHPAIYRDFVAGVYPTLKDARVAAGVLQPRTPLQELKNAWRKASPAERAEFLRATGHAVSTASSPASLPVVPFSIDRILTPGSVAAIQAILSRRKMRSNRPVCTAFLGFG